MKKIFVLPHLRALLGHTLQKINRQILKKKIKRVANLSKLCIDKSTNHTFMSLFVLPLSMPVSPTLSHTHKDKFNHFKEIVKG